MSDTLADLASWLPSDFLSGDITHHPPYDFASSSSTESESDDDDVIPGLTHRFTRSVSLQERLKVPYTIQKKRVFSVSPESTLNWNACGPTHVRSSPTTPFGQPDNDALELIYAAAGQVARMKMNAVNHAVYGSRSLLGAPRPLGPPLSHLNRNCTMFNEKQQMFFRQQQLRDSRDRFSGGPNYPTAPRFVSGRPVGVGQPAWPPYPVERRQQPGNEFGLKPVPVGSNGRSIPAVKKGCAGTGVFLPRNYSNAPPETKKNQVCSAANPAGRVLAQSMNKNHDPIVKKAQANMNGVFLRQNEAPPVAQHHNNVKGDELAEMIMAQRQRAVMLAQQRRSSSHESVPEVVLPQEWTY
ncbi:hypothetical protein HanPI659440_Chr14g0570271 [Helianthus annuus]|nr:hypothetical protein HanPI659440_Chr14g0570271 [Helianthus annuus]